MYSLEWMCKVFNGFLCLLWLLMGVCGLQVDCVVGVSVDSVVVVEEATAAVIFATSCKSVIGWTLRPQQG